MNNNHMVDVRKKSIIQYLYSNTMKNFMFVFFLASAFTYSFFYGYGTVDSPRFYWIMAISLVYMLLDPDREINPIDFPGIIICLIFFLVGVFQYMSNPWLNSLYNPAPYAWVVPTVYFLGKAIVGNKKSEINSRAFIALTVIAVGSFLQGVLNYIGFYIYMDSDAYNTRTFWNPLTDATRSTYNFGFFLIVGSTFYAFLQRKKKKLFFKSVVVMTIISIAANLFFKGRTMLLMVVVINFICMLLYLLAGNVNVIQNHKQLIKKVLITIAALVVLFFIFFVTNAFGIADAYNNSFLSRDGGIFNNVRLKLWRAGWNLMIENQKGGWNLDENIYQITTPHNAWLEYARHYDIIVFSLWALFWGITLIWNIRVLLKYEKKYSILYYAIGGQIVLFIYSMVEPGYIMYQDLLLFHIFICGLISGIENIASSGDYKLLHYQYKSNIYRYLVFGFGILTMALLGNCYRDWWSDRLQIISTFIVLTIPLIIGGIVNKKRAMEMVLLIGSLVSLIAACFIYVVTCKSEYYKSGYYIEPFTGNVVEKSVIIALLFIPIAIIFGFVLYKLKLNKKICAVLIIIITCIICWNQIHDGRISVIKEALRLQLGMDQGLPWINSKDNIYGIISSHSMWLEYARDYGILTLGLLVVFEIWGLYCFIRIVLNKNKDFSVYVVMIAFILFNYNFAFEASAYTQRYIFALGMFIYGALFRLTAED